MSDENFDKIKKVVAGQLGIDEAKIVPEASFSEDLSADSLDTVELIMALEEEFGIEIPDEDAQKLNKVQDVLDYIEEALKKRENSKN